MTIIISRDTTEKLLSRLITISSHYITIINTITHKPEFTHIFTRGTAGRPSWRPEIRILFLVLAERGYPFIDCDSVVSVIGPQLQTTVK